MTRYAICFDFPESPDPWFATIINAAPGFITSLADAKTFESEEAAERFLTSSYGAETRSFGVPVEVGH